LDGIRVEMDGQKRPLNEFATVTVKDGKDLLVTCYEESVSRYRHVTILALS
jgi:ribosome recycling factor